MPSKRLPLVALSVTVCTSVPLFCQQTDCPTVIVADAKGEMPVTVTIAAAPLLVQGSTDEGPVERELLQAMAVKPIRPTSAMLKRI